jgi:hypothetical protein
LAEPPGPDSTGPGAALPSMVTALGRPEGPPTARALGPAAPSPTGDRVIVWPARAGATVLVSGAGSALAASSAEPRVTTPAGGAATS